MIAIFQSSEAAAKLLAESPLRFTLEDEPQRGSVTSAASFNVPELFDNSTTAKEEQKAGGFATNNPNPATQEFLLTADRSYADHEASIERHQYYWGFPPGRKSFISDDLMKSVPLEGLAYISAWAETKPNRIVKDDVAAVAWRKTLRQVRDEAG